MLDTTTGQNAVNQAGNLKIPAAFTGIVLTKLDGRPGGVVIAIKEDLNVPVKFIGVGEQIDDLQPFDPEISPTLCSSRSKSEAGNREKILSGFTRCER